MPNESHVTGVFDSLWNNLTFFLPSSVTGEGIMELRQAACDKLLLQRVDAKMRGKKTNNIMNRLRVATPMQRDNKVSLNTMLFL